MSTRDQPLVSCIMPTRNRRVFVRNAISRFLRQDYPHLELVVVDDGTDNVADLIPSDERIRYRRLGRLSPLGEKRNIACELARGDVIAHVDDDDWMASNRIRAQVAALKQSGKDVCGLAGVLHYQPWSNQAWRYAEAAGEGDHITGGTLVYRRRAWQAHAFPAALPAPTRRFLASIPADVVHTLRDPGLYVAVLHSTNTTPKNLSDPRWQPVHHTEVVQVVGGDLRFFDRLRSSGSSATGQFEEREGIVVAAPFLIYDGYGSMAQYLALGLSRAGVAVHLAPLRLDLGGLSPDLIELLRRSRPNLRGTVLCFCPGPDTARFQSSADLFVNTMWETNRLPAGWADQLNRARAIIVPSTFAADAFRQSGVTAPVEVVAQGIDPTIYRFEERPARTGITTLMVGPVCARKNTLLGIHAWKRAFAGDPDARLILKARWLHRNYVPDDPRIQYVDANEQTAGIAHWYREADVLLALGNEGFGLPLVEAMATGLPVVALNSEGQADVCREAGDLVLSVPPIRWEPFDEPPFGPCGVRAVPDVRKVAARLAWLARHRTEAQAMGAAASGWVLEHRNVWHMGPAMLDVIEHRSRLPRRLRRPRAIWAPARDGACVGVGHYARCLAAAAPGVRLTQSPPETGDSRLIHVQHVPAVLPIDQLEDLAHLARGAHVPVVLTMHQVGPTVDAAELHADLLVAVTEGSSAQLKRRWPERHVEYVPYGCPTWFPPRKRAPGRVVAVWGALTDEGIWQIVEAVQRIPRAELLLVAGAAPPSVEEHWRRASQRLRVERVAASTDVPHQAAVIAASADVLVYWGQPPCEVAHACAVREGLATGVPVLVSPEFAPGGLAEVTYQPADLAGGLRAVLDEPAIGQRLVRSARDHCLDLSWHRIVERHLAIWRSLENP